MPAVSVIMPAFNVEPYLGQAIDSVLAQTCADLELLVVDDGSSDHSLQIAEERARRDRRVRVMSQPNQGISSARNRALAASSGDLIAILDGDDLWEPSYLASQMAILAAHPDVDVVTGNAWFLGGPYDGRAARPTPDPRPAPDLTSLIIDETAVFILSVFRRRVYEAIGGFDEVLRTNEDYDFWLRAAVAGFRFTRNDKPLGQYRRRDDSLSANEVRMLRGILQVFLKLRGQLADRPAELPLIDAQILRFDTERLAAEAKQAIEMQDFPTVRDRLADLYARRGGTGVRVGLLMARWTPRLLALAYRRRQLRQAARRAHSSRALRSSVAEVRS